MARTAIGCHDRWSGDRILGEVNNGGDYIEAALRAVDNTVPYRSVHASRGKLIRAEPVAALYEQHRVHHVGRFDLLEDQMCDPAGSPSPDRMDALVWLLTDLLLEPEGKPRGSIW
jgi:phage terminase large subunit-like protein